MANMVILNNGKKFFLNHDTMLDVSQNDCEVKLFKNSFAAILDNFTNSDFTEATFPGYAAVTILAGDFSSALIVANVAEATHTPPPIFDCTGGAGELVYGWWLKNTFSGVALCGQKFDTPLNMVNYARIVLDPFKIKLKSFT